MFGEGFLPYEADGIPENAGYPDLAAMTAFALDYLDASGSGFFLMVESGLIDQAAHANNSSRMVGEVHALDKAVAVALAWAHSRQDTLIVVTADHETGGLQPVQDQGAGILPEMVWTTTGHTATPVDA